MRILFKIAKNELRYLFYSPIAWFVILVFLIECAVLYTSPLYDVANSQDIMLKNSPGFEGFKAPPLTIRLFMEVFQNVISNLYLFIPVLTMGLISREQSSGSAKLLYSSPVPLRQVVLGKYLGIVLYNLLLVAILFIFMIAGMLDIRHVDYGMLLSAALGFYLLVCAYAAIGLFMSALSTYQIISALGTFIVIFALSRIGGLWQRYDVVRDLTWFLSLQNRTLKMLGGLIVSKDVVYFLMVSGMFVAFTLIKLRASREVKPWYIRVGRYCAVMAVTLILGYISSRPLLTGYWDTTATKRNTIPKEVQQLIKNMGDSTLEVTLYTNLLDNTVTAGLPESRNAGYLTEMWEPYLRFKPEIKFSYRYYYDNDAKATDSTLYKAYPGKDLKYIAGENAELFDYDLSFFRSPEKMRRVVDLRPEGFRLVMQLKYKGRTEFLRTFNDPFFWPDLTNVSAAFKRLLEPEKIPKVYFVSGQLERSIYKKGEREYALHTASRLGRAALVNIGYDVDTLNLTTQDIPDTITLLALADPKIALSTFTQEKLKQYISAGGNLLLFAEPGKQQVLNPILQQLGVRLMQGQLVEPTYDETPDKIIPYETLAGQNKLVNDASRIAKSSAATEKIGESDSAKVLLIGVAAIDRMKDGPFTVTPLLKTVPDRVWLKAGNLIIDSTLPPPDPAAGDLKQKSFDAAVLLTRQTGNNEQRIALYGDADFAGNQRGAGPFSVYSWMDHHEFPVSFTRIAPRDLFLRINAAGAAAQRIVFVWLLPALVLLAAIVLLVRRKRK
ncbi:Gldg family protein [Niabella beijingensis]|uniref:Gldg family protein n=1 Tax=Niabella beijingensis TaxID=2872700 RepID=UPI001CBCA7CA|nr:Gldg family protein [Niabella beijingensis]MBZ4189384.1 Gldg family protein [Niabella beijingensis]